MKSLTGNRRVVEILNHMGHAVSYHTAESIETEIASKIAAEGQLLPNMLLPQLGLSTGLAWDNYDELTETLSVQVKILFTTQSESVTKIGLPR